MVRSAFGVEMSGWNATGLLANMLPLVTGGTHEHFRTASQALSVVAKSVRRRCIQPSSWQDFTTTAGNYILAFENHFIAGRHGEDGVQLNLSHRTHTWTSFVEREHAMGHCLSRDSETGMLSIDTSLLDLCLPG